MSEYDAILNRLLESSQGLTREEIEDRVRKKKEKIGAGYLTDQGALFLIASDLGISLSEPLNTELRIKDLYIGAKEVSLKTRVLNLSPTRQLTGKDGSSFLLRTMTVYDDVNSTANVKLWNEKANLPVLNELKSGDLIKITKAYIKSDTYGAPVVNVGSNSSIEISNDESDIPPITSITKNISEIRDGDKNMVVSGLINGSVSSSEFTNSRGRPGKMLKMRLKGDDGKNFRIVLWGKDDSDIPSSIPYDTKVLLLGVRAKMGNQGDLEIHGNDSTSIEIKGSQEIKPIIIRIISKTTSTEQRDNDIIFGTDQQKKLFIITDSTKKTGEFVDGDVIECMPSKLFGNSITLDDNSFVRKIDDDSSIPNSNELRTVIADIKPDGVYCIDAIILEIPKSEEKQTRDGRTVTLAQMFVEDDTGSIWVKAWRDQAEKISSHSTGEIISITGVRARLGFNGKTELSLTPYSKITIKKTEDNDNEEQEYGNEEHNYDDKSNL